MIKANTETFEQEVLRSDVPALVDFFATWCGPCKMLTPVLEELAKTYEGRVKVVKVDVDESPELAAKHNISAVPTLLLFKNGNIEQQAMGFQSRRDLVTMLDKVAPPALAKAS